MTTTSQLTVAALAGNAAAGGLMLALAADEVWCRAGAVLNPHYQLMLHPAPPRRRRTGGPAHRGMSAGQPRISIAVWPGRPGDRG